MNMTEAGRSCRDSINDCNLGLFASQLMLGITKYCQMPASRRICATASWSFLEQIELMIPRRARVCINSQWAGMSSIPPSVKVPFQKVSSRSQITNLTGSGKTDDTDTAKITGL